MKHTMSSQTRSQADQKLCLQAEFDDLEELMGNPTASKKQRISDPPTLGTQEISPSTQDSSAILTALSQLASDTAVPMETANN